MIHRGNSWEFRLHLEFRYGKDFYLYECSELVQPRDANTIVRHLQLVSRVSTGLAIVSTTADLVHLGVMSPTWQDFAKGVATRAIVNGAIMYGSSYVLDLLPGEGYLLLGVLALLQGYSLYANTSNIGRRLGSLYSYLFLKDTQTVEVQEFSQSVEDIDTDVEVMEHPQDQPEPESWYDYITGKISGLFEFNFSY